jgi:HSP20 family protein
MAVVRWRPGFFGWRRDPLAEMDRIRREMDKIFDSYTGMRGIPHVAGVFPALNVSEDQDNLYVRAELPGVDAKDIEITTEQNNLIIKGNRKIPTEGEKISYHRREREAGTFRRIISLPSHFDSEKVKASCKDGLLTVTLPKAREAKPRQIKVQS